MRILLILFFYALAAGNALPDDSNSGIAWILEGEYEARLEVAQKLMNSMRVMAVQKEINAAEYMSRANCMIGWDAEKALQVMTDYAKVFRKRHENDPATRIAEAAVDHECEQNGVRHE